MKRMTQTSNAASNGTLNLLKELYLLFVVLPNSFRDKVLEECSWSVPTFYRKMRDSRSMSNAEKEKVLQIALEQVNNAHALCTNVVNGRKDP
jgi:hypothetical protein